MPEVVGLSYSNIVFASAAIIIALAIGIFAFYHRKISGASHFVILSLLGILWGAFFLFELFSKTMEYKNLWDGLQFIPMGFLPPVFLTFTLAFTGRTSNLHKPSWVLLYLLPVLNIFVIWTNDLHHFFRLASNFQPGEASFSVPLIADYGTWFWIILAYSLSLLIISAGVLFYSYIKAPRWSRTRIAGMLIGAILPTIAGLASIPVWLNQIPVNITLISMVVTISIISWSLFGNRLLDVIPLARSTLLGQLSDAVITLDPQGIILDRNTAADQIPLLNLVDHIGESLPDLLHSSYGIDLAIENCIEHSEEVIIGSGEDTRTYDMRISPVYSTSRNVAAFLVVFREITRRKLEEVGRVQIEERYRAIFENSSFGILLLNQQGVIVENNVQSANLSGYSNDQIIFRTLNDLIKGAPEINPENGNESYAGHEASLLKADGEAIPVELNITPIYGEEENYYFVTIQDIRQRKRAESVTRSALDNVQSRIDELAIIRNVTETLNQATTLRAAILPVLETVTAITKSQSVWLILLGKSDHSYQRIEYHPLDEDNMLVIDNIQADHPKCLERLIEGKVEEPALIRNCICSTLSFNQNHFTLPLYIGKQSLGVLNFSDDKGFQVNENKVRLLHTVCDSLAVAIERVRLFRSEHDQRKLSETLRDIGTTLTASLDLNEVLDLLLDQLSRLVPYDGGNVMLIENSAAKIARFRGYEHLGRIQASQLLKYSYDIEKTDNIREICATRKPVIIQDTAHSENWKQNEISLNYHGWLGVPVIIEGKVEAIFCLDKVEAGFYTQEHAKLVSVFATQASLAIKNARLFTAEAKRLKELDGLRATLASISSQLDVNVLLREIVKRAINLLNASQGEIGLFEPSLNSLRILVSENMQPNQVGILIKVGEGLMGKVAEKMAPLNMNDFPNWNGNADERAQQGLLSGLAVPMLAGNGELLGVIEIGDKNKERLFFENDIRLLNLFAQQATIALRNAQLFENAKRRAEEAETIRKAGAVVVSTLNQEEAIRLILEQLALVVPYDSASVLLHQKGVLKIVGGHGFADIQPVLGMEVTLDRKNPGAIVFLDNKPHFIKNIPEEVPTFNQYSMNNHIIHSWLGVPLTIQDNPIGILSLDAHDQDKFSEEHARLVTAFADQVAIALENSRLYEDAVRSSSRFETLYRLSQIISANIRSEEIYPAIYKATTELMDTEFFSISLVNEKEGLIEDVYMIDRDTPAELTKRPITQGLFGKVIEDGNSRLFNTFDESMVAATGAVLIGDMTDDEISQSVMVVPLRIGQKLIGVLSAQSYQPYAYTDTDLELLELLAANVAIAIENARLFSEVQELAITDPLTSLYNRRKFIELADQEFNRSKRYNRSLSVIMLDIDRFKVVNDTYGHSIGDQVLVQLADICSKGIRQVDFIARYGGEEFMILLPEAQSDDAMVIAERLRKDTENTPITTSVGQLSITISLGVAGLDESCASLEQLLDRADFAQYASKDAGRNRASLWTTTTVQKSKDTGSLKNGK